MNKIQRDLFALARDSEKSFRVRIAAAVVHKNRVISYGFNQNKSHPFQDKFKKNEYAFFLHAETDAIKNALRVISIDELSRCTLYVTRVKMIDKKTCGLGLARPCVGCMQCLIAFPVRKVVYSNEEGDYDTLWYDRKTSSYS